tara:strand:- start:5432 stop:6301 length:870 start_codon:yes stop_codon:yes gene_type:complete
MYKHTDLPTLFLILACYAVWGALLFLAPIWLTLILLGPVITLHSSLQHEALHGHPFRIAWLNTALVWPSLVVLVPYARFRDTHLAHHFDPLLTDPYEDPETNYLDPAVWHRASRSVRRLLLVNNTLLGRLAVGPIIGMIGFAVLEVRGMTRRSLRHWLFHLPAMALVLTIVWVSPTSFGTYAFGVYFGLSILKLRTFLEHKAARQCCARTAIVESGGVFGFLFLNNNLHVVHHVHPSVAWYKLPGLYAANKENYLRRNDGYRYSSYWEILRRYAWRAKDPVAHPLWQKR